MFDFYFSLSSLGSINPSGVNFLHLLLKYFCFLYSTCTFRIFIDFLVFPQSLGKSCIFSTFNLLESLHKSTPTFLASFWPLCLFDLYLSDSEVFKTAFIYSIATVTITAYILVKIFFNIKGRPGVFLQNCITNLDLFNHPFLSRPSRRQ